MRFLQKIVPFVLFSHHGLPSFSVFVSCFGFLGWNCRFPKSVPFASLNFSGAFGKSFMDGFFFFFEFPEMKTFLFARYFTTMHRFFFLRISGIAFCIGRDDASNLRLTRSAHGACENRSLQTGIMRTPQSKQTQFDGRKVLWATILITSISVENRNNTSLGAIAVVLTPSLK